LARLALVIPAVPERLALVIPEIVLFPATIVLLVRISPPARVASVPVVGSVTEVAPVVRSESALVGEKVITSPPAKVMEFVANVVESETVNVFPVEIFKVLVPLLVMASPLIVVTVAVPIVPLVASKSVNQPFVSLAPLAPKLPVIVKEFEPKAKFPPEIVNPPVAVATVISAVPSNETPPIKRGFSNAVAVKEFPETLEREIQLEFVIPV